MDENIAVAVKNDRLSYWLENILVNIAQENKFNYIKNVALIAFERNIYSESDRRIAIIINSRNKGLDKNISMSCSGGKINRRESELEAMKREFGEEYYKTNDNVFTSKNHRIITSVILGNTRLYVCEYDFYEKKNYKFTFDFDYEIVCSRLILVKDFLKSICTGRYEGFYSQTKNINIRMRLCFKIFMERILKKDKMREIAKQFDISSKIQYWSKRRPHPMKKKIITIF